MKNNVKIAKQLIKLAKNIMADQSQPWVYVMKCTGKTYCQIKYGEGEFGDEQWMDITAVVKDKDLRECLKKAFKSIYVEYDIGDAFIAGGNHIGISCVQNDNGQTASKEEIRKYQNGEITLWNSTYDFQVTMRLEKEISEQFLEKELQLN